MVLKSGDRSSSATMQPHITSSVVVTKTDRGVGSARFLQDQVGTDICLAPADDGQSFGAGSHWTRWLRRSWGSVFQEMSTAQT